MNGDESMKDKIITNIKNTLIGLALAAGIVLVLTIISDVLALGTFIISDILNSDSSQLAQREVSPDGEHIAYVVYVYGGATAPDTCQIKIAGKYSKYTRLTRGNVYIGSGEAKVEWVSDDKLIVYEDNSGDYEIFPSKTYKQETEYKDIEIEYDWNYSPALE